MILKKLQINHYGPFSQMTTIDIDPEVTVLTGRNDVGKSAVLNIIETICTGRRITEDQVNVNRFYEAKRNWEIDKEIYCIATFVLSEKYSHYLQKQPLSPGSEVDLCFYLTTGNVHAVGARNHLSKPFKAQFTLTKMPQILILPLAQEISSQISTVSANSIEKELLNLAFGRSNLTIANPVVRRGEIKRANERLNNKLHTFLPEYIGKLVLDEITRDDTNEQIFSLSFQDGHAEETPLEFRGLGVRKILSLMVSITTLNPNEHLYILMDEPETSLHADAQHLLRKILDELGKNENIQVIYATHSPSMINSVNPRGVRLFTRASVDGKATTVIENNPIKENFLPIRVSLGLTPGDSLLYAPVTVITEGDTEIKCLPKLFRRFYEENINGFDDLDSLLSLCHFIDATGDKFVYWCRLVKSQGCHPVLFLDGDKTNRIKSLQANPEFSVIPIVTLDEHTEFENIVEPEAYFEALKNIVNDEIKSKEGEHSIEEYKISLEDFRGWEKNQKLHKKMLFSKRVTKWLLDNYPELKFVKSRVMQKALELASIDQINLEPFEELVNHIREAAKKLS